jgi:hypothetical protein
MQWAVSNAAAIGTAHRATLRDVPECIGAFIAKALRVGRATDS